MTSASGDIERQVLELLAGRPNAAPAEPPENVSEYDWDKPHSLTADQAEGLNGLAEQVARSLSASLTALTEAVVELAVSDSQECYARALLAEGQAESLRLVSLLDGGGETVGLLCLPHDQAAGWVAKGLGGERSAPSELTNLETGVLEEIVERLAAAIGEGLGGPEFALRHEMIPAGDPVSLPDVEETVRFAFQADEKDVAILAVRSQLLQTLLTASAGGSRARQSPQQIQQAISEAIGDAVVDGDVVFGATDVMMREIASLEAEDVLVLDAGVDDPMMLTIDGQPVLRGQLVQCRGAYAVRVEQWSQPA